MQCSLLLCRPCLHHPPCPHPSSHRGPGRAPGPHHLTGGGSTLGLQDVQAPSFSCPGPAFCRQLPRLSSTPCFCPEQPLPLSLGLCWEPEGMLLLHWDLDGWRKGWMDYMHGLFSNCTKLMSISDCGEEATRDPWSHSLLSPVSEDQKASSWREENNFSSPLSWSLSSSLWLHVFQPLPLPSFSTSFCHLCLFTVPKTMSQTLNWSKGRAKSIFWEELCWGCHSPDAPEGGWSFLQEIISQVESCKKSFSDLPFSTVICMEKWLNSDKTTWILNKPF